VEKKNLIIIAGSILIAGLLAIFYTSGAFNKTLNSQSTDSSKTEVLSDNQAHSNDAMQAHEEDISEDEPPTVEISPEKQQLIGVKTVEALIKPIHKIIRTTGRVEYDETRLSTINTKFEGWIERLYVDYTGKYVKKGEPVADIYSPELFATQMEFINLLKWKNSGSKGRGSATEIEKMLAIDAESIIEAAKQRLRLWDITDEQIKKIEETGKPVRTLTIYSPVSGYIVQKVALQGMRVMPGEKLLDIADLSRVWIISDIYEYEMPFVKIGQPAKIRLSYFSGRDLSATIDYIYPALSGETRTAKARLIVSNPDGQLKPQMFTNVEIKIDLGKRLVVPDDAVIDTGIRQIVYVDKGNGYFEPREILTGIISDGLIEVIDGLKRGDKVAASANFLIDSEAQLKGIRPLERHKH
jgi:Cu(I)/Ag(I) efflux system membrane fusion protein